MVAARERGSYYYNGRWVPGILTNYKTFGRQIIRAIKSVKIQDLDPNTIKRKKRKKVVKLNTFYLRILSKFAGLLYYRRIFLLLFVY